MTEETAELGRLVLGLHYSASDRATMELAAKLAQALGRDLFGLFLADESVLGLAGLPFAREFRPLGGGWQPLDAERLAGELDLVARTAGRLFAEAARTMGAAARFQVVKASAAQAIASTSQAGDVVLLAEPRSAAERVTHTFLSLVEAAFESAGRVMFIPRRIARERGPIVVIAHSPSDTTAWLGLMIATLTKEDMIVIETGGRGAGDRSASRLVKAAEVAGVSVRRVQIDGLPAHDGHALGAVLGPVQERLLVVGRRLLDEAALSTLASLRGVPVLVVDAR